MTRKFDLEYRRLSQRGAAVLALSSLLLAGCSSSKPSPTASANTLIEKGISAENAGNVSQALLDYQEAIADNPIDSIAYYDEGVIFQSRNSLQDASSAYQKALVITPDYKPALFNLAIVDSQIDPIEAVHLYNQLNGIDPHDPNVLLNMGLLLRRLGSTAQANQDLAEAVKLNPSYASRIPPTTITPTTTTIPPSTSTTTSTVPHT